MLGDSNASNVTAAMPNPTTTNVPSGLIVTTPPATAIEMGVSDIEPKIIRLMTRPIKWRGIRRWTHDMKDRLV